MSAQGGLGSAQSSADAEAEHSQLCYICLQEGSASRPLLNPCKCPRPTHRECLARWQLHQSGKSEETQCRFCFTDLPDWKPFLLGEDEANEAPRPLMAAVVYDNRVYKIPILPGPEGKAAFKRKVNELFGLTNRMFDVTFECKVQADKLSLRGLNAYEAATRCAALSARQTAPGQHQQQPEDGEAQQQASGAAMAQ